MNIEFECELASGLTFSGDLEIEITGTPSPATREYPGDPLEFNVVGACGEVWDEELDTLRDLTPSERSEVLEIASNDSDVDYKVSDTYADMSRYQDWY